MKSKKITGILISSLLLFGCGGTTPTSATSIEEPEDTNLEFWITQRVKAKDLEDKGCTFLPGWFGAEEYLDSRYVADTSEGMAVAPEIHVTYLLTGYPDVLDETAITHIDITDPIITVYGLMLDATIDEARTKMEGIADSFNTNEEGFSFQVDNCSFTFTGMKIIIDVPVTNNSGIVF